MLRYLAVCLLLAGIALGQSSSPQSTPTLKPRPNAPPADQPAASSSNVAPDAPVITVPGLCDKPAGLSSSPADCKTVITRAEFEKVAGPNMAPVQRKAVADQYVKALVLEQKAHEQGLDHSPEFEQQMKIARLKILANMAVQQLQKESGNVPDNEIEDYYRQHTADYKTISFERLYIPKQKFVDPGTQKPNDPDADKKRAASEAEMKEEADKLRTRAAAGEDLTKLQQEAYDFAGLKQKAQTARQDNVRKNGVPPADASIFELKSGDVSQVFNDPTGLMIYKIDETKDLSLENVRDEISRTLQSEKMKNSFDAVTNSAKPTLDENYFATPAPPTLKKPGEPPTAQVPPPPGKK